MSPARRPYKLTVRLISVVLALGVMAIYSASVATEKPGHVVQLLHRDSSLAEDEVGFRASPAYLTGRRLFSYAAVDSDADELTTSDYQSLTKATSGPGQSDGDSGDDGDQDNCTAPRGHHAGYNDSCTFVQEECSGEWVLFDYLSFILCDMMHVEWLGYIILALWLIYLISLLATTADNFFIPPLNLLSKKLRLSPSIAGITLLAIGNGAPDVFTAYASLSHGHIELVLGALIGASIFISTVVLGTIILIVNVKSEDIDKIDFVRDIIAYMCAVGLVIGIAFDGIVFLWEATSFLLFYIIYIVVVVVIGYMRKLYSRQKQRRRKFEGPTETDSLIVNDEKGTEVEKAKDQGTRIKDLSTEEVDSAKQRGEEKERLVLLGLTYPRGAHIGAKIQWFLEWPVSLLRWLSIPPCYYDDQWSKWHHWFAVTSPVPMAMVLLVAAQPQWTGFTDIYVGKLPLFALLIMIGVVISVALFFILSVKRPPHWIMQIILGFLAFVMSIAWLNIEANEVVAVLDAFGLSFGIDTGILGLTVLAIGNSVGDWVADTAVARAGKPGMGISSCFGSPLLNDVIGLSVALIAKVGFYGRGSPFTFPIHDDRFAKVKLSWIFLGISLLSSAIVFPLFKFRPPKPFGVALIYLYIVFMVFSVLNAVHVMPLHFA